MTFGPIDQSESELLGNPATWLVVGEVAQKDPLDVGVTQGESGESPGGPRRDSASLAGLVDPVTDLDVSGSVSIVETHHSHELPLFFDEECGSLVGFVPLNPPIDLEAPLLTTDGFAVNPRTDPRDEVVPIAQHGVVNRVEITDMNSTNSETLGAKDLGDGDQGHGSVRL